ncbi:MAG: two-component system sensor histidine kinase BarA [Gammaproteobacteria bacterium]|jgi:two-component system sensor histidine kinase BarA
MKRPSIKYQILVVTLLPVFLVDLFFTYFNINSNIEQASTLLQSKGRIIARQIAGAAEFDLISGTDNQINILLRQSINTADIVKASVLDNQGLVVASASSNSFKQNNISNYFYYREPVVLQNIDNSDIFSPHQTPNKASQKILGWVHLYVSRQSLEETKKQIFKKSVLFFILALILAVMLAVFISRRITRPIITLRDHLKRVEKGNLGETIKSIEKNEIGAVQNSFNRMTEALMTSRQHLNEQIEQATVQLNDAISDLESKNKELGFARDEALAANQTKSRFLANMSHEIRTPINGIKGFIGLLANSNLDERQQSYADTIFRSTQDLISIIDEILDFSKVESGKLKIVEENFNLIEVLEQSRDILFISALSKDLDLNLIVFSDTPNNVVGDKLRLKQILMNLIGNAIKFTYHGEVIVRVLVEALNNISSTLTIDIEDTGIGISEKGQIGLFSAFSQADTDNSRRNTGTGLGLMISRNLSQLMGGDISLTSTEGKGSCFTLTVPIKLDKNFNDLHIASKPIGSGLVFSGSASGRQEIHALFERAGVEVESVLVSNRHEEKILDTTYKNAKNIDFVIMDLRHITLSLPKITWLAQQYPSIRIIVTHHDQTVVPIQYRDQIEFISTITAQKELQKILRPLDPPVHKTPEPNSTQKCNQWIESRSVLLVDDNQVNLKLGAELIRIWGHTVIDVNHAIKAMALFEAETFDLIILDIQMPDIDGIELLNMMRNKKPDMLTPIVALTANALDTEESRLLELGFDYYLSKPIDEDKFQAIVNTATLQIHKVSTENINSEDDYCIESFSFEKSLELSANSHDLLSQILQILLRDIPDHLEKLESQKKSMDITSLAMTVHKLQGITCYASLPKLKQLVTNTNCVLEDGSDHFINEAVTNLIKELKIIQQEVIEVENNMTQETIEG